MEVDEYMRDITLGGPVGSDAVGSWAKEDWIEYAASIYGDIVNEGCGVAVLLRLMVLK